MQISDVESSKPKYSNVDELEELILEESDTTERRFKPKAVFKVGALALLLAAAFASGAAYSSRKPATAPTEGITVLEQVVAQKAKPLCSKIWGDKENPEDNCASTKCCEVSGYQCFQKQGDIYGCLLAGPGVSGKGTCDPAKGWTCKEPHDVVPLVEVASQPGTALYCFAVYTKNTGSTKVSHELELLTQQRAKGVSLFSCDNYDVFSDVSAQVGAGYNTIKVEDPQDEFHLVKRKTTQTWVNTGMFKQVWKSIRDTKAAQLAASDWVVKVDADAVFFPERLKNVLKSQRDTYTGVYLENCLGVEYGFFGNLEVFSRQAFKLLLDHIDTCSQKIDWVKGGKWGPIGEDLFAQQCMDYQGVSKIAKFDLATDGACPSTKKRFGQQNVKKFQPPCSGATTASIHPFKKPAEYFACLEASKA